MVRTKQTARKVDVNSLYKYLNNVCDPATFILRQVDQGYIKRTESYVTSLKAFESHCKLIQELCRCIDFPPSEIADKLAAELPQLEVSFRNVKKPFARVKQLMLGEIEYLRAKQLDPKPSWEELKAKIEEKQRQRDKMEMEALEALVKARLAKLCNQYTVEIEDGPTLILGCRVPYRPKQKARFVPRLPSVDYKLTSPLDVKDIQRELDA
jgi:hypothetical protein